MPGAEGGGVTGDLASPSAAKAPAQLNTKITIMHNANALANFFDPLSYHQSLYKPVLNIGYIYY
jgi:hypothetical protein